jgi:tetratricopeptide (TPR) repeat protein
LLLSLTLVAMDQGHYDDAESFGQQGLTAAEQAWGDNHWRVIDSIQLLAAIYVRSALHSKAEPLLQRLLRMDVKPHKDRVVLMHYLELMGRMYRVAQLHVKSAECYQRAFELVSPEKVWREFPEFSFNFVSALLRIRKIESAETVLRTGQNVVRETFLAESLEWASWLEALAHVRVSQKRDPETESLIREALAIREKLRPDHSCNLTSWCSLGNILAAQDKSAEAEECFKKALHLCEKDTQTDRPSFADILKDYADLLQKLGRTEQAFDLHHRAAHIEQSSLTEADQAAKPSLPGTLRLTRKTSIGWAVSFTVLVDGVVLGELACGETLELRLPVGKRVLAVWGGGAFWGATERLMVQPNETLEYIVSYSWYGTTKLSKVA